VLGLTDDQFYALTPRQYHLLLERHRDREKHTEWMVGLLASTVANWSMGAPKEPLQPRDFPLLLLRDAPSEKHPRINRRRIAKNIRAQFQAAMAQRRD